MIPISMDKRDALGVVVGEGAGRLVVVVVPSIKRRRQLHGRACEGGDCRRAAVAAAGKQRQPLPVGRQLPRPRAAAAAGAVRGGIGAAVKERQ